MKYLKPPMLSMNFSENKEGMKKRISNILSTSRKYSGKICLGLLVFCVCVIGGVNFRFRKERKRIRRKEC